MLYTVCLANDIVLTLLFRYINTKYRDRFKIVKFIGPQEFDLPKSVVDIIYAQNLCWYVLVINKQLLLLNGGSTIKCFCRDNYNTLRLLFLKVWPVVLSPDSGNNISTQHHCLFCQKGRQFLYSQILHTNYQYHYLKKNPPNMLFTEIFFLCVAG